MNKKNIIIILITIILIAIVFVIGNKGAETDAEKFKREYENLNGEKNDSGKSYRELNISKNNPIIYSTADEIVDKIDNKETFAVYFFCVAFVRISCFDWFEFIYSRTNPRLYCFC